MRFFESIFGSKVGKKRNLPATLGTIPGARPHRPVGSGFVTANGEEFDCILYALKEGSPPSEHELRYMARHAGLVDCVFDKAIVVPLALDTLDSLVEAMKEGDFRSPELLEDPTQALFMAIYALAFNMTLKEHKIDPGDSALGCKVVWDGRDADDDKRMLIVELKPDGTNGRSTSTRPACIE
jgi:hypothetical protein